MSLKIKSVIWNVPINEVQLGKTIGYEVDLSKSNSFSPVIYSFDSFNSMQGTFFYSLDGGNVWVDFPAAGFQFSTEYKMKVLYPTGYSNGIFAEKDGVIYKITDSCSFIHSRYDFNFPDDTRYDSLYISGCGSSVYDYNGYYDKESFEIEGYPVYKQRNGSGYVLAVRGFAPGPPDRLYWVVSHYPIPSFAQPYYDDWFSSLTFKSNPVGLSYMTGIDSSGDLKVETATYISGDFSNLNMGKNGDLYVFGVNNTLYSINSETLLPSASINMCDNPAMVVLDNSRGVIWQIQTGKVVLRNLGGKQIGLINLPTDIPINPNGANHVKLNRLNGNICFSLDNLTFSYIVECNLYAKTYLIVSVPVPVTDILPISSSEYVFAHSRGSWLGYYSNGSYQLDYLRVSWYIWNIAKSCIDDHYYVLSKGSSVLAKIDFSDSLNTIWSFSLPHPSYSSNSGSFVVRNADGLILYNNNRYVYLIKDNLTSASLIGFVDISNEDNKMTAISPDFHIGSSCYFRAKTKEAT